MYGIKGKLGNTFTLLDAKKKVMKEKNSSLRKICLLDKI
jgi:hypothetical protein